MGVVALGALHNSYALGGLLTVVLGGVKLYLNKAEEAFYIEVDALFTKADLKVLADYAIELGYEVMPEWECPPEELSNGVIRHWMAEREVEVLDDRLAIQTV